MVRPYSLVHHSQSPHRIYTHEKMPTNASSAHVTLLQHFKWSGTDWWERMFETLCLLPLGRKARRTLSGRGGGASTAASDAQL